jgi:hypothetical protein
MSNEEPISISFSNVEAILINDAALHDKPGFDYSLLWMPAIGVLVLAGLTYAAILYSRRRKQLKLTNDPDNLFYELCAAHSLSWSQKKALLKLAQLRNLNNPCLVIMDAGLWPEEGDPMINRGLSNKLNELRRNLFEPA